MTCSNIIHSHTCVHTNDCVVKTLSKCGNVIYVSHILKFQHFCSVFELMVFYFPWELVDETFTLLSNLHL